MSTADIRECDDMEKITIIAEKCKSCGYCVAVCPKKILEIGEEINKMGYQYAFARNAEDCISCRACATICPEAAIELWK